MPARLEREGQPIELISDADLAVLNGLDHEIERRMRRAEAYNGEEPTTPLGHHLSNSRHSEVLSRYHPAGDFPRKSLKRLERAGLVESRRNMYGISWFVTSDGDALLEEYGDDLPGPLCDRCWDASALPDLKVSAPVPDLTFPPDIEGECQDCAEKTLAAAEKRRSEIVAEAINKAGEVEAYCAAGRDALEALPDD